MSGLPEETTLRLDKWLWFARLAKTRSLAARLCAGGAVAIAGQAALKPHHRVRVGDTVTLPQGHFIRTVRVAALGTRRLYSEPVPPRRIAGNEDWMPLLDATEEEAEPPIGRAGAG